MKTKSIHKGSGVTARAGSWRLLVLAILAGLLPTFIQAMAPTSGPEAEGYRALRQQDYQSAAQSFQSALQSARAARDTNRLADMLFYLGVTYQRQAQATPDPNQQRPLFAQAERQYRTALRFRPGFGAARFNLAQLAERQGNLDAALDHLRQALELKDARQPYYTERYADLLLKRGESAEACRFYALAAWAQPDNDALHEKLVRECLRSDRTRLLPYLWEMLGQGQVHQAEKHALNVLTLPGWLPEQNAELLAIATASLIQQPYAPDAFNTRSTAMHWQALAQDSTVRRGAQEVVRLHDPAALKPNAFSWWRELAGKADPGATQDWKQQTFVGLARSLGDRWRGLKTTDRAEQYYRFAATLNPRLPDTQALVRLAELDPSTNRLAELSQLMQRHEERLFSMKGEAYRASDFKQIYDCHVALGVMYARLNKFGSGGHVRSATFQLEHALQIAQRAESEDNVAARIRVAPVVVDLLAQTYEQTGQTPKAYALRLDKSEQYLQKNDPDAARAVLKPVLDRPLPTTVPATNRTRLQNLQRAIERPTVSGPQPNVTATVTVRLAPQRTLLQQPEKSLPDPNAPPPNVIERRSDPRAARRAAKPTLEPQLSPQELKELERAVSNVVQQKSRELPTGQFQVLSSNAVPENVREIQIQDQQGRVLLRKGGEMIEVPFTIEPGAVQQKGADRSGRFVKP